MSKKNGRKRLNPPFLGFEPHECVWQKQQDHTFTYIQLLRVTSILWQALLVLIAPLQCQLSAAMFSDTDCTPMEMMCKMLLSPLWFLFGVKYGLFDQ